MSNFLTFVDEDIEAKKTLFSTMPTNTKTDIRKFNEKIASVSEKYKEYKSSVKKYLDTKNRSFNIKNNDTALDELSDNVSNLEHVRFVLNPTNTYFEKMGFDNLLYEVSNYYDFNFNSLIEIINKFLDKFEQAGIKLTKDDFNYTCYVSEYMTSFLEIRNSKGENYDKVSEIFEKIYWLNPDIISHIELNFRKLIKRNERQFSNYIDELQKKIMMDNKINSYEECLEKLKIAYNELSVVDKETIIDIIDLAKNGAIDINNYFEDSKTRTSTYNSFMINSVDLNDKLLMDKFYDSLEKLKNNIVEYNNYIKFIPLIDDFKKEYAKQIPTDDKGSNKNNTSKNLKTIESQINDKESKLEKLNKKIFKLSESKHDNTLKYLKIDSIKQAKELYNLYKTRDLEYFKEKVLSILNSSITISELLHLYYSFDYFKKMAIKKVFNITTYDEITKYSDSFDLFAMNPTNIIVDGVAVFEENDVGRVIMNKYRLDNINLTEESLNPDDLNALLEKVQFVLRVHEIQNSPTTVEKIWFVVQVEKINKAENKGN